jgi:SAM-dependent methyltransferase
MERGQRLWNHQLSSASASASAAPFDLQTVITDPYQLRTSSTPSSAASPAASSAYTLPSASFDLILSSLMLHWSNDLPYLLHCLLRALRPDGCFLGCMLGGSTLQELRSSMAVADMERLGGVTPHVSPFAQLRSSTHSLTHSLTVCLVTLRAAHATSQLTQLQICVSVVQRLR